MTASANELPCPQCRDGKPCGGKLRPVDGAGRRWRCDKCGRAVAFARKARGERKGNER